MKYSEGMDKIYFVSNRPVVKDSGIEKFEEWSEDTSLLHQLRFGEYNLNSGKISFYPESNIPKDELLVEEFDSSNSIVRGSDKLFKELGLVQNIEKIEKEEDVLFYIHGYRNSLERTFENAKQIYDLYVSNSKNRKTKLVVFIWPSQGRIVDFSNQKIVGSVYKKDQKIARNAGVALARFFIKLANFKDTQLLLPDESGQVLKKFHLFVHSMGNTVFKRAFFELDNHYLRDTRFLFNEVLLIAADAPNNVFEHGRYLRNLIFYCDRIHVYYHHKDVPLKHFSARIYNREHRLGLGSFTLDARLLNHVYAIDCTNVNYESGALKVNRWAHHWYHLWSQTVVDDISKVLDGVDSQEINENRFLNEVTLHYRLKS